MHNRMKHQLSWGIGATIAALLALTLTIVGWTGGAFADEVGGNAAGYPSTAAPLDESEAVPGETILTFDDPADARRVVDSAERSDALDAEVLADDVDGKTIVLVSYEQDSRAISLMGAAEALPGVEAQPNYVYELPEDELVNAMPIDAGDAEEATAEAPTSSREAIVSGETGESGEASQDAAVSGDPGQSAEGSGESGQESDEVDGVLSENAWSDDIFSYHSDKYFDEQYYVGPIGSGYDDSGINLKGAWDLVRRESNRSPVTVAVIDSGLYTKHEDLQENIRYDYAYDYYYDRPYMSEGVGHGTTVTGVIVADVNGKGVCGVASGAEEDGVPSMVQVLPLKVYGSDRTTSTSYFVKALEDLDYQIHGAGRDDLADLKVINISSGGSRGESDRAFHSILDHLYEAHDILTVCSAGNDSSTEFTVPSDYDSVLSVAALSRTGANADYTNYNRYKDISAPGDEIATTAYSVNGSTPTPQTYSYSTGTSFSAPITSAVAALMYSVDPNLTPEKAMAIIKETAAPLPDPYTNYLYGMGSVGALDAEAAVRRTIELRGDPYVPEPEPVKKDISNATITLPGGNFYYYTGQPITPGVTVTYSGRTLTQGVDYTLEYGDNVEVGYGYVRATGIGDYEGWAMQFFQIVEPEPEPVEEIAVYRLYNPYSTEHLLTPSYVEYDALRGTGWRGEGIAFYLPETSDTPIYRLYNPYNDDHHYTTSLDEYNALGRGGWKKEGILFYGAGSDGTPVYRLWNRWMTKKGGAYSHLWTASYSEYWGLSQKGWTDEGIAWRALS